MNYIFDCCRIVYYLSVICKCSVTVGLSADFYGFIRKHISFLLVNSRRKVCNSENFYFLFQGLSTSEVKYFTLFSI